MGEASFFGPADRPRSDGGAAGSMVWQCRWRHLQNCVKELHADSIEILQLRDA
jgi:hypothetical protein